MRCAVNIQYLDLHIGNFFFFLNKLTVELKKNIKPEDRAERLTVILFLVLIQRGVLQIIIEVHK